MAHIIITIHGPMIGIRLPSPAMIASSHAGFIPIILQKKKVATPTTMDAITLAARYLAMLSMEPKTKVFTFLFKSLLLVLLLVAVLLGGCAEEEGKKKLFGVVIIIYLVIGGIRELYEYGFNPFGVPCKQEWHVNLRALFWPITILDDIRYWKLKRKRREEINKNNKGSDHQNDDGRVE